MTIQLKPIKAKRVSDQAYEQIRDLVFRGQLKPGDQIMPERELAQALGVSRPTVREAIKKLVTMGLLEHRQGQGTFVSSTDSQREHNPLAAVMEGHDASLEELLEVRIGLEGQSVILAAQRATAEDLQVLETALEAMFSENAAGRLGIDEDVAFHMALAFASKNPVQVHIMKSFYDLLHYGIKENLQTLWEEPASLPIIRRQHQAIFAAIKNHDPEAAYQAMREHITFVLDFVRSRKLYSPSSPE
ncbi:MAG: FadR/GntR family transcriptional regulator [Deltaproteobacteria bacterium]|nr:FadR/GntR family transcriptional regulator [Deltaproteobacteria bacterium]